MIEDLPIDRLQSADAMCRAREGMDKPAPSSMDRDFRLLRGILWTVIIEVGFALLFWAAWIMSGSK